MLTRSLAPGMEVYGEKRITVENSEKGEDGAPVSTKVEYRVWNPFRSKLAAGIIGKLHQVCRSRAGDDCEPLERSGLQVACANTRKRWY